MSIVGDVDHQYRIRQQEIAWWGSNDLFRGTSRNEGNLQSLVNQFNLKVGERPKLYIHIPGGFWSTLTGKLREYCLPWRWKTAYLDEQNGSPPRRILVCTNEHVLPPLSFLFGKSLPETQFLADLYSQQRYEVIGGHEYIRVPTANPPQRIMIQHLTTKFYATTSDIFCPIFRKQGLFSNLKYKFLQLFSDSWKEVAIRVNTYSEKILIKKVHENSLLGTELIEPVIY